MLTYFQQVQQSAFDDIVYKVDITRNIAVQYVALKPIYESKTSSAPNLFSQVSDVTPFFSVSDEEEQAIAGRLQIRVIDTTGGATFVQTDDKEIFQSRHLKLLNFAYGLNRKKPAATYKSGL